MPTSSIYIFGTFVNVRLLFFEIRDAPVPLGLSQSDFFFTRCGARPKTAFSLIFLSSASLVEVEAIA